MRVTAQMFPNQLQFDLSRIKQTMDTAQNQISSGQRVKVASDGAAAYRRSQSIQASQLQVQQWRQNINNVRSRTEQDIATAKSLNNVVTRASEIATRAVDGLLNPSDLQTLAVEMDHMLEEAVSLANKQYNGQYLYGGTSLQTTDTDPNTAATYVPFIVTRGVNNQITNVAYHANTGGDNVQQVEIGTNSTIASNVVGSSATGTPRGMFINNGVDIFSQLITLRDALASGNASAVQSPGISDLRQVEDNVASNLGILSANLERLNTVDLSHNNQLQADEQTLSNLADTDLPSAVFQLTQAQTAFQAALQVGASTLNLSLLNYLR